ncbi:MAG: beta-ketoacyl-[acyl-carrier-protein] synthase family protein [Geobacteraceae bacterium]|nr:beta-ketoacyl-[acyl-carrier-protein] synthase family protein [Geobacteraceae bacterium]
MQKPGVGISGAGCVCGAGMDLATAYVSMLTGERNPQAPQRFSTTHADTYPVFEILSPLPAPGTDAELLRTTRLALSAAHEALNDAQLDRELLRGLRVGVCIGTTVGSAMNSEEFYRDFRSGKTPDMAPIERYLRSNPAAALARHYQLDGPSQVVANACSSGTDAIGVGAAWIRAGLCDMVIAGGADELCRTTYNGFASLMITDTRACRPFDVSRRGLNLGEGAGVLVLESDAVLKRRGRRARGYVLGYANATDSHHLTAPHPEGRGLKAALARAISDAGIEAQQLAFLNAHGTGTPDNDKVESKVLCELFPEVPVVSTKGYTGHTLGAAGAIEATLTLVGLEQGRIPANAGFSQMDPALGLTPTTALTPVQGSIAVSESLAFGGNNAALVLGLEEHI